MTKISEVFVVLMDTNAISALSLYVSACNALGRNLGIDKENMKSEFKNQKGVEGSSLNFVEIEKGLKVYNYLQNMHKLHRSLSILISCLSEIELLNIFLERVFDRELTRKGIPYRIRRKRPFRVQVDFDYEKEIIGYWESIKGSLGDHDIEFECPEEDPDVLRDTIKVSKVVVRHVALEPVDLYLYSLGIFKRADEIYTYDEELRVIINNIWHRNINWRDVCDNIKNDLREYILSFEDEYRKEKKISLPKGVNR